MLRRAPRVLLLLLLLPLSARAQAPGEEGMITVDAGTDPSAFADTSIYEEDGTAANGAGQVLPVGQSLNDDERRSPLQFDFAGRIPIGSEITHVVLTLTELGTGSTTVDLHRLSADWGEGGTNAAGAPDGAPAAPGDATWTDAFFDSTSWTSAGGDFEAAVSGSLFITAADFTVTWDSDVSGNEGMVADVQHWLQNPSQNFGWILIGDLDREPRELREPGAHLHLPAPRRVDHLRRARARVHRAAGARPRRTRPAAERFSVGR